METIDEVMDRVDRCLAAYNREIVAVAAEWGFKPSRIRRLLNSPRTTMSVDESNDIRAFLNATLQRRAIQSTMERRI